MILYNSCLTLPGVARSDNHAARRLAFRCHFLWTPCRRATRFDSYFRAPPWLEAIHYACNGDFTIILDREGNCFCFLYSKDSGPTSQQGIAIVRGHVNNLENPHGS
jgi:hypothetical protein